MTSYQIVSERIQIQLYELEPLVSRAIDAWHDYESGDTKSYAIDAVALNLQRFYSGVESLFEIIARRIDNHIPTGESWHQELVSQMAMDVPDHRPAVISETVAIMLDELRRFRHIVRHVYGISLAPDKIGDIMQNVPDLWQALREELLAFAQFLADLDESID